MSIRAKILFGLLLLFVPTYLLLIGLFIRGLTVQKQQVLSQHLLTAQALAIAAESFIKNDVTLLRGVADRISSTPGDARRALAQAKRIEPGIDSIAILGEDQWVVASVPDDVKAARVRVPPSVTDKIDKGAKFAVSGVRSVDEIFGFNVVVPVPVLATGPPDGFRYVSAFVRDKTLAKAMVIKVGEAGNIGLIDSSGKALVLSFLADPSLAERDRSFIASIKSALQGRPALNQGFRDPVDGVRRIGASAPIPSLGWAANVFEPEDQALSAQRRLAKLDALLLLMLLALASVIAWLVATRLVRPIEALARASESIAAGELSRRVTIHTGDELEEAAASFNRMAGRIQETIETERSVADLLRETLLPSQLIAVPWLQVGVAQGAASEQYRLGGDFYVVFRVGLEKAGIIVGDITGKGIQAAALAMKARYVLASQLSQGLSPAQALTHLNRDLCISQSVETEAAGDEETVTNRFVTAIVLTVDLATRKVMLANAGHPQPLACDTRSCEQVRWHGPILGVFPEAEYRDLDLELTSESSLVLVTDGVTEARRFDPTLGRSVLFGERRFAQVVTDSLGHTPQGVADAVFASVLDHSGDRLADDTVVMVLSLAEEIAEQTAAAG